MNVQMKSAGAASTLTKADIASPCLKVLDAHRVAIKAGTAFNGIAFEADTEVQNAHQLLPGRDYYVTVTKDGAIAALANDALILPEVIGGFHFAPGGNAKARDGGDEVQQINPCSLWDLNFRPACGDARGMTLVEGPRGPFWCDIYLLTEKHDGLTSRFGVTIADGDNPPQKDSDEFHEDLNYATAVAVMNYYGKQLLSFEEFAAAAYGVKEKSSCQDDPETTKCDAARTSKFGLQQATGNLWVWGHDGDPDDPRPSVFGGSWFNRSSAGSRCALLAYWPGLSDDNLGARGRSDHLQLG